MFRTLIVYFFLLVSAICEDYVPKTGIYKATINRIVDGDTFYGDCEIWPGLVVKDMGFRFYGVAAPELKEKNGQEAKDYLKTLISENSNVIVEVIRLDKYSGRTVVKIWVEGKDKKFFCLNDFLLKNELFGKLDKNGKKIEK